MTTLSVFAIVLAMASPVRFASTEPATGLVKAPNQAAVVGAANSRGMRSDGKELQESARPYLIAAREALKQGNLHLAEGQCRAAMNVGPKDATGRSFVAVRQLLAEILIKQGKNAEAAEVLRDVAPRVGAKGSLYPSTELLTRALAAVRSGDYATALAVDPAGGIEPYYRTSSDIMENAPGVADANHLEATILLMRALRYCSCGQDAEYAADAFAADKLVPGNPLISSLCGDVLRSQGKYIKSERYYKLALEKGKGGLVGIAKRALYGVSAEADWERKQLQKLGQ